MKNKVFAILTVLILILILSACNTNRNATDKGSTISSASNENITKNSSTSNTADITAEQAEQIALDHAGVKEDDTTFKRTEFDFDDGIYKYEIEFYVGTTEYDYEINAKTGDIISFDKDID